MSQDGSVGSDSLTVSDGNNIEPLPGLETIFQELLQEDGYDFIPPLYLVMSYQLVSKKLKNQYKLIWWS